MLTLKQFIEYLASAETLSFVCNNKTIPAHFHITELAYINKIFIDCWGIKRHEQFASMQIWVAGDIDHRLSPSKLSKIIELWSNIISDTAIPLLFEYQWSTIESYHVSRNSNNFILEPMYTNCLAQDKCGISPTQFPTKNPCCGNGCC